MVRSSKGSLAVGALEGLHSGVLAHVTGQLIRAGKLPVAPFPVALVWFLPSVGPLVSLEVRALGVHLGAARVGTAMHTFVALGLGIVIHSIDQLVGTVLSSHGPSR